MTYSFKKQFAPLILSGNKVTTVRAPRKDGKVPKPQERLHLFTGMRTKQCRKIGDRICRSVSAISICDIGEGLVIVNGSGLEPEEREPLANRDGFKSWAEMLAFFKKIHPLPFNGWLIEWYRQ